MGAGLVGPVGVDALRWWARMARDPLRTHLQLAGRYGPAARLPLRGGRGYYVLTRPEHAEHLLVSGQANYVKAFTIRTLRAFLGDGLLTSDGDVWRRHRRLVQPVFAQRHVAAFAGEMVGAARRRAETWPAGGVVDAAGEMRAVTLDVVGRALFGSDLAGAAGRAGEGLAALQRGALVGVFLPIRSEAAKRWLARAAPKVGSAGAYLDGLVRHLVAERRAAPAAGEPQDLLDLLLAAGLDDGEVRDEVLTLLVAGHETTAAALAWALVLLSRHPEARERLEAEAAEVLPDEPAAAPAAAPSSGTAAGPEAGPAGTASAAGTGGTAGTGDRWSGTGACTADADGTAADTGDGRLRAAATAGADGTAADTGDWWAGTAGTGDRWSGTGTGTAGTASAAGDWWSGTAGAAGPGGAVDADGRWSGTAGSIADRLPWTTAVVSEVLRLFPPAWRLTRDAVGADDVAGVPIPARSTVSVPPYLLHRCPDVWPSPERFRPERFLEPQHRPRCAYLPFGAGKRTCVGGGFAMLEATLVLATLARTHRLDLVPGTRVRPRAEVTLRPAGPIPMRVQPR